MKELKTTSNEPLVAVDDEISDLISELVNLIEEARGFLDNAALFCSSGILADKDKVRVKQIQAQFLVATIECFKILRKEIYELELEKSRISEYIDEATASINGFMLEIETIALFAHMEKLRPVLAEKIALFDKNYRC